MKSSIERTVSPAAVSSLAVPPVETISIAELGEAAREVDDPGLVGHRQQRALDPHLAGLGHGRPPLIGRDDSPATTTRRGLAGSNETAPRAISAHGLGEQLVLDRLQGGVDGDLVARVGQLERALQDDRPAVDPLVDEVDA